MRLGLKTIAIPLSIIILILSFQSGKVFAQVQSQQTVDTAVGTVIPRAGAGDLKFFCQWAGNWRNQPFDSGTVASSGCGPTSMAMIIDSFGGSTDPGVIAKSFDDNGFSNLNNGHTGINYWDVTQNKRENWLNSQGFASARVNVLLTSNQNLQSAKKFLEQGYLLWAAAYVNNWGNFSGWHAFVITSINGNDINSATLGVMDPNDSKNCYSKRVVNHDIKEISGWSFLIPIHKSI